MSKNQLVEVDEKIEKLQIQLVDIPEGSKNSLTAKIEVVGPQVIVDADQVTLVPTQYIKAGAFATVTLLSQEMDAILRNLNLTVLCNPDSDSVSLPEVGQRIPVTPRRKKIRGGWTNSQVVPDWKVETIGLSLFGVKVTKDGIVFGPKSLAAIYDGAGRVASAMDELNETDLNGETPVFKDRNILWQLNMDLSGEPLRTMQVFLLHNKEAKKATRGTTMCVENATISLIGKMKFKKFSDPFAATFICRHLYDEYPVDGSVVCLLPWRIEGQKSENMSFQGKGTANSIVTAVNSKSVSSTWDESGVTVYQAPEVINFAFRYFYKHSKDAVTDALQAARRGISGEDRYGSQYHFHSTLAVKVMLYLTARIWPHTGGDEKKFGAEVSKILHKHYQLYKVSYQVCKGGFKKMDVGDFWKRSLHFTGPTFNSGEGNTIDLMRELKNACDFFYRCAE